MQAFSHFTANDVQLKPFSFRSELLMGAYLIENKGVLALDRETFKEVQIVRAELTLKQGRGERGDGRADLIATYSQEVNSQEYIAIIELKLGELTETHLKQLEDYLKEKNQILDLNILDPELIALPKWIGVLVGSSIELGLAKKISDGYITDSGIQIAALTIQRFRSEKEGNVYVTTDTYFKGSISSKDTSKYVFNGTPLRKGRLVLEVIKHHVGLNPDSKFADLESVFPKSCQGRLGVFTTVENANEIYDQSGYRRYFNKPEELVKLSEDCTIAICSQWGIDNIDKFIQQAIKLGYKITPA